MGQDAVSNAQEAQEYYKNAGCSGTKGVFDDTVSMQEAQTVVTDVQYLKPFFLVVGVLTMALFLFSITFMAINKVRGYKSSAFT